MLGHYVFSEENSRRFNVYLVTRHQDKMASNFGLCFYRQGETIVEVLCEAPQSVSDQTMI